MNITEEKHQLEELDWELSLADFLLYSTHHYNIINHVFAYKKVANKVLPIPTVIPDYAKIICRFPENPLLTLPAVSQHPPPFTQGNDLHRNEWMPWEYSKMNFCGQRKDYLQHTYL